MQKTESFRKILPCKETTSIYISIVKREAMKYLQCLTKESDIENLLEDSDTEYIAEEPIPDNKEESHQLPTPEGTVHVEGEVLNIDEAPAKKLKKKVAKLKWKRTSKFVKAKKCTLKANVLLDIPENANPLLIFANLYATQMGESLLQILKKYAHF